MSTFGRRHPFRERRICQQYFRSFARSVGGRPELATNRFNLAFEEEEFRKLELIPAKKTREKRRQFYNEILLPPRATRMPVDQDWPSVWPNAASFKASVVPLPVRMGYQRHWWRNPPPAKQGNLELIKIPNFLHLTPPAVKRHCDALKKFCSKWPENLNDEAVDVHFPVRTTVTDYVNSGNCIRDARSRIFSMQFKLSSLPLDDHARDKFVRLVGERYDAANDVVTFVCDSCPSRHQNRDYAHYLLTAVFYESWKYEPWEEELSEADLVKYDWDRSQSRQTVMRIVGGLLETVKQLTAKPTESSAEAVEKENALNAFPGYVRGLEDCADVEEHAVGTKEVNDFRENWDRLRNEGETEESLRNYGDSVRKLLGLPSTPDS